MKIALKKLTECTIQDTVTAWNRGFEGYFVPLEMTAELFFNRMVNEGLSLKHSLVAFDGEEPVAIVLNGFRIVDGKKIAWNGGTGIAAEYRGRGVSTRLMEEAIKVYSEAGVIVATLEAIKENDKAIRLYEKFGYEITDSLVYLGGTLDLSNTPLTSESIRPEQFPTFSFYKENVPWQCQWQSVRSGEAQIYFNSNQNPIGYSLYKRTWDQNGYLEKIFLYQLELFDRVNEETIKAIFTSISGEQQKTVNFMTINAPLSNPVIPLLLDLGFEKKTEQVQMVKKLNQ
ncbi:GNAT family N-acetyltransferase [Neobacillus sp. OS1-33]|uniref:GNAT family N-acetyltransferase n=1 Tax=Neobacillus sp. OS1-33 TaxID=3070683 RepID=UPI0027DFCFFA|nr:GNAT family N-acetyltransferase [Neobacillus sp. OS1-33]WML26990.1 GNAT family N-acetyltransferase [Neobacillus sp. OS1-33]